LRTEGTEDKEHSAAGLKKGAAPVRSTSRLRVITVATFIAPLLIPFLVYFALARHNIDPTWPIYIAVVLVLLVVAASTLVEGRIAVKPDAAAAHLDTYPHATAVIAAYLPNEVDVILDTLAAFGQLDYPGQLDVVLAYNTTPETRLLEGTIQDRFPRVQMLRVDSGSKAENVMAAARATSAEIIGVFDADHRPAPDVFTKAAERLAEGADVVQGRCVSGNASANLLTRLVAVEFEGMYGIDHVGRPRLHGWGIFGGSNGYWRTSTLRRIGLDSAVLTEDIDASVRLLRAGGRIVTDRTIISRELSPTTLGALWHQRLRWAQGWAQVAARNVSAIADPGLSPKQRTGLTWTLGVLQVYPWVAGQMFPLLAFWTVTGRPLHWVPLFVLTTVFTLAAPLVRLLFVWRVAVCPTWKQFVLSALFSFPYSELRNAAVRTAQVRELLGDRPWKVTPRPALLETA
jgi:cellulose synthase/poly-beta-1,6-N-acetylglucosamine synthase-like glycosyltransferase